MGSEGGFKGHSYLVQVEDGGAGGKVSHSEEAFGTSQPGEVSFFGREVDRSDGDCLVCGGDHVGLFCPGGIE